MRSMSLQIKRNGWNKYMPMFVIYDYSFSMNFT